MKTSLDLAELEWTEEGLPYAPRFGDFYFSREDGLAETRHTFLLGNRIGQRFAELQSGQRFTLVETGFGTGLNFLATWQAWQEAAPAGACLDYYSIEAHPLRPTDLARSHLLWPELQPQAESLQAHYPVLVPGFHCLHLAADVRLLLIFADIETALPQLGASLHPELQPFHAQPVDAWYLDGFAPRSNPQMWQESLFPYLRALSHAGTSLATFTSAGAVRRGLTAAGFEVRRVPGFGRKREMLVGELPANAAIPTHPTAFRQAEAVPGWTLPDCTSQPQRVTILGAGIAGATLAARLADAGIEVDLIDACDGALQKASGNPQVAVFARLSPDSGELEDFALSSLVYAQGFYRDPRYASAFHADGLIQLPRHAKDRANLQAVGKRFVNSGLVEHLQAEALSRHAGIALSEAGLWFPHSGWIDTRTLATALLKHPGIHCHFGLRVSSIEPGGAGWLLKNERNEIIADTPCLVICTGQATRQLSGFDWLPLRAIRGQISRISSASLTTLQATLCSHGYLTPALQGLHCVGATYDLDQDQDLLKTADDEHNFAIARQLGGCEDAQLSDSRSGVRCATPDYLPICGSAPNPAAWHRDFASLAKDRKRAVHRPGSVQPGLYLNLGFGSRGYCYAPLCAEHLSSLLTGRLSPLPHYLSSALHPGRFIIRQIIRRQD